MKQLFFILTIVFATQLLQAQQLPKTVQLPNGWKLSPAGKSLPLGDLPLNMTISQSKKLMAVTSNGQGNQCIELIDVMNGKKLDSIGIQKSFYGLQFSSDEKFLYAAGGHDNRIMKYSISNNKIIKADSIQLGRPWPNKIGPSGIAIDEKRNLLYTVTREDNNLYIVDLNTKKVVNTYGLDAEAYACIISPDNQYLYISCWGCDKVLTFDLNNKRWLTPITVGDNPNEMLITADGKLMYVCNANDNSVSVIDLKKKKVIETLDAALYPNSPSGSTTNSVALDAVNKRLYIANADNNCVAVFDVSVPGNSVSKGFIPTGWYPTVVRFVNNKIWVANGKGMTSKANPFGPSPVRKREEVISHGGISKSNSQVEYIGGLFTGSLSMINPPAAKELETYTKAVYQNTSYSDLKSLEEQGIVAGNPIPSKVGQSSPIKYVFYVIKENRTYDQVLGDVTTGNGDTSLVLFGRKNTPNQHAIVENFALLDNFYVDAEVSADGHNWSMGAYANDYLEKTWPTSYSGRGGTYGGEGEREIANNKNGFIWDNCNRYGVSFRTYGEFVSNGQQTIPVLKNHFSKKYPDYNLAIRDTMRVNIWRQEFDSLLSINAVPHFNTVRLGNDHTEGLRLGRPSPYAHVADNDLAVGMFIETLAKSPIWNETAVFIVEDDAQNGSDHVDAHRSPCYVAGGFVKRNVVDHTLYSTSSVIRTMELILGMAPMTQYDAAATPMWRIFDNVAKPSDFKAILPQISISDKNMVKNIWQQQSEKFSFVREDSNNDIEFNKMLWHGLKGDKPYPTPRRSAFVMPLEKDRD